MQFSSSEHSKYTLNSDSSHNVGLYKQARVSFIQKVYSLLTIQLAFTALCVYVAIQSKAFMIFNANNSWLLIVAMVVCVASQLFVFLSQKGRSTPYNFYALGAFTVAQTYCVAGICSSLCWELTNKPAALTFLPEQAKLIGTAALLTIGLVGGITAYAFTTKTDYTMGSAIFSMLSSTLMLVSLVYMFSNNSLISSLYLYIGLVVFGFYLLIDTQRIVGGKRMELKTDEYATGAMLLYADIVVLFLKILRVLQKMQKKDDRK